MRSTVVVMAVVASAVGLTSCESSRDGGKPRPHPLDAGVSDAGASAGQGGPQGCGPGGQAGTGAAGGGGTGGAGGGPVSCKSDPLRACPGTTSGRWCVEMLPGGSTFEPESVWSDRPDDVWVVGWRSLANGDRATVLLRGNGCTWTELSNPAPERFPFADAVWGSSGNDVWIMGAGDGALHFDGESLTFVPMPIVGLVETANMRSISGTGPHDVWAVGTEVWHWDGEQWTSMSVPTNNVNQFFADVWAVAPNDVWITGDQVVAHFDGAAWAVAQLFTDAMNLSSFLYTVWSDGTDVWAAGPGGRVHHYQNGAWSQVGTASDSGPSLNDLGGLNGDVHLVGTKTIDILDGAAGFVPVADAPPAAFFNQAVWVSPSQVWVVSSTESNQPLVIRRAR